MTAYRRRQPEPGIVQATVVDPRQAGARQGLSDWLNEHLPYLDAVQAWFALDYIFNLNRPSVVVIEDGVAMAWDPKSFEESFEEVSEVSEAAPTVDIFIFEGDWEALRDWLYARNLPTTYPLPMTGDLFLSRDGALTRYMTGDRGASLRSALRDFLDLT